MKRIIIFAILTAYVSHCFAEEAVVKIVETPINDNTTYVTVSSSSQAEKTQAEMREKIVEFAKEHPILAIGAAAALAIGAAIANGD